jgi:hypothetical protein
MKRPSWASFWLLAKKYDAVLQLNDSHECINRRHLVHYSTPYPALAGYKEPLKLPLNSFSIDVVTMIERSIHELRELLTSNRRQCYATTHYRRIASPPSPPTSSRHLKFRDEEIKRTPPGYCRHADATQIWAQSWTWYRWIDFWTLIHLAHNTFIIDYCSFLNTAFIPILPLRYSIPTGVSLGMMISGDVYWRTQLAIHRQHEHSKSSLPLPHTTTPNHALIKRWYYTPTSIYAKILQYRTEPYSQYQQLYLASRSKKGQINASTPSTTLSKFHSHDKT